MGGNWSGSNREEIIVFEVQNDALQEHTVIITVILQPKIVDGTRLSFMASPKLKNQSAAGGGGGSNSYNILGAIRDEINVKDGEKIIIRSIVRTLVHNDLPDEALFEISNIFDVDDDTEADRRKIDEAIQMDTKETLIDVVRPAPPKTKPAEGRRTDHDNNAPVSESSGGGDDEGENALSVDGLDSAVDALVDNSLSKSPFEGDSPEEILRKADEITVRGQRVVRNEIEVKNVMSLGSIPGKTTVEKPRTLYTASVSLNVIKWFAGQENFVWEPPSQIISDANTSGDATDRANRPVIEWSIYPPSHSLVQFIGMFADDLQKQPSEIVEMKGDRDDSSRWLKIDQKLVKRAREMIKIVVYAQIYYTTLSNCKLTYIPVSEDHEKSLLLKLAKEWHLHVDPKTKRVSDWPVGAYRPCIAVTLRVTYFVVKGVKISAATLHKKQTMLSVVKKK